MIIQQYITEERMLFVEKGKLHSIKGNIIANIQASGSQKRYQHVKKGYFTGWL